MCYLILLCVMPVMAWLCVTMCDDFCSCIGQVMAVRGDGLA